jgi:acyl-coenzyme A thioesterase PaaI-like protein
MQRTHLGIDPRLCGAPDAIGDGEATVTLGTLPEMAADDRGLVHGGFVFGLADHAAMLAVNDPNVVLGAADSRFTAPVRVGEVVTARARRTEVKGRRHLVEVSCTVGDRVVYTGLFTTFVLDRHVLEPA